MHELGALSRNLGFTWLQPEEAVIPGLQGSIILHREDRDGLWLYFTASLEVSACLLAFTGASYGGYKVCSGVCNLPPLVVKELKVFADKSFDRVCVTRLEDGAKESLICPHNLFAKGLSLLRYTIGKPRKNHSSKDGKT